VPLYPRRKKIQKYNTGGQIGSVDPPLVGIGIQYVPTAPNIPNLDAAKYLDEMYRNTDTFMYNERSKRKPNEAAIRDLIMKYPGTTGMKAKLTQDVIQGLRDYERKTKNDLNWVFSDEGKESLRSIENIISPSRFQNLSDSYNKLQANYDMAFKNNTLNQLHINNDKISVTNLENGSRQDISLKEFEDDLKNQTPKYSAMTVQNVYDKALSEESYELTQHEMRGDLYNPQQAINELRTNFEGVGITADSDGIISTKNNIEQLEFAKKQAIDKLSSQSKSTLLSEYFTRTKQYKPKGFDNWLNQILDEEVKKRMVKQKDVDLSAAAQLAKQNKAGQDDRLLPIEVPVHSNYPVTRNAFFGEKTLDLHLGSVGSPTDRTIKQLPLNGEYFVFGNTSLDTSDEKDGNQVSLKQTLFKNAMHIENATFPVSTGEIRKRTKEGLISNHGGDRGKMIIKNEETQYHIPKNAPLFRGDDGRLYFENKDGEQIMVQMQGFKVYDVYGENDKESTEAKPELQVFVPMNRRESLTTLGTNYSGERTDINHFKQKNNSYDVSDEGFSHLLSLIEYYDKNKHKEQANLLRKYIKDAETKKEARTYLNSIINNELDKIKDADILKNSPTFKSTYVPGHAGDNRNIN
jgi:hypothetical protein